MNAGCDLARRGTDHRRKFVPSLCPPPKYATAREWLAIQSEPLPVVLAKLGVAVAVGVRLQILHVQELQGHAHAAPLAVNPREVGQRPAADALAGQSRASKALGAIASTAAYSVSPAARARRTVSPTASALIFRLAAIAR
jgi:hypothetical protein